MLCVRACLSLDSWTSPRARTRDRIKVNIITCRTSLLVEHYSMPLAPARYPGEQHKTSSTARVPTNVDQRRRPLAPKMAAKIPPTATTAPTPTAAPIAASCIPAYQSPYTTYRSSDALPTALDQYTHSTCTQNGFRTERVPSSSFQPESVAGLLLGVALVHQRG